MRIFVTGAGGYIGRHVVTSLLDKGAEVYVNDFKMDHIDNRAKRIDIDIFKDDDVYNKAYKPDVCLHMAWKDGFVHNSHSHIGLLSNHYNFINNMFKDGLKHLAVMGSMHEVGYYEGAISEDTPCNPISNYGIAKDTLRRSSQLLAKEYNSTWQWIRAYYISGDDKYSGSIFKKIIEAVEMGKKVFPFTSGKNKYDFIDIKDLANMISETVMQDEVNGIINCCSGKPVSLSEYVERFIKEKGFDIKLEYGAFPDRDYDSPSVWGDNAKIKKIMTKNNM